MDRVLRQFSSRPRIVLWACLATLVTLSVLTMWALPFAREQSVSDFLRSLCSPAGSKAHGFASELAMWSAMTLAMMLPSAAPMLSTYLDIAEAAHAKSISVVSPVALASGYIAVWLSFTSAAAIAQGLIPPVTDGKLAGLLFIAAGLYQFTPLKHACLTKCRHPMPYFLANWSEERSRVFRMGVEQGLNCLGCCWAIMLLTFAAGAMSAVWMAMIGLVMILEKVLPAPRMLVLGVGAGLAGAGVIMVMAA
jgi:predicted metal-binding membrane protein